MLKDADPEYFSGIYIVCGYTDLRYGIDSLAAILERKFHAKLFVPNTLFLFCGRSASKIKGLLWEGDGFLLLYKRVESGHFSWPRNSNDLRSMTAEQFHWLMQGFRFSLSYIVFCNNSLQAPHPDLLHSMCHHIYPEHTYYGHYMESNDHT